MPNSIAGALQRFLAKCPVLLAGAAAILWGMGPTTIWAMTPVVGAQAIAFSENNGGCAITQADALVCYGGNEWGLLGNGSSGGYAKFPVEVIPGGVKAIAIGYKHACAIVNDALLCWGDNDEGQVGVGTAGPAVLKPTAVIARGVTAVSARGRSTCAVVGEALQCWGKNDLGQIGNGAKGQSVMRPTEVIKSGVSAVAVGGQHTCAIERGDLKCWGFLLDGKELKERLQHKKLIAGGVTRVAAAIHTCAIVRGALQCWGRNFSGQTGVGAPNVAASEPTTVIASGVTDVAVTSENTCAVVNSALQCWGMNSYGKFGPDFPARTYQPVTLIKSGVSGAFLHDFQACAVLGGMLSCQSVLPSLTGAPSPGVWQGTLGNKRIFLCSDGRKATYRYAGRSKGIELAIQSALWTESVDGKVTGKWQLEEVAQKVKGTWKAPSGTRSLDIQLAPSYLGADACNRAEYVQDALTDQPVASANNAANAAGAMPSGRAVIAANRSALVVRPDGSTWEWGDHTGRVPVRTAIDFVRVWAGEYHALGLQRDGSLWGWGSNTSGQLGGDEIDGTKAPVKLGDGFVEAAASGTHSFGIKRDGSLWAWGGAPSPGKFDDGSPYRESKPKLIGRGFIAVAARDEQFAAIKAEGTLWMSGGYDNELVLAGTDFAQVSVGYSHTAAIKKDGNLWTWGSNRWGTRGDGSVTEGPNKPFRVGDGYRQVVAGFLNTAAVKTDGSLWAWGSGNKPNGLFGDCNTEIHPRPVKLGDSFEQVALGQDFILASKTDGSQWTWGYRWDGDQLETPKPCRKPTQVIFGDGVKKWDKPATVMLQAKLPSPQQAKDILGIAAGGSHSALVKADGTLLTWGNNEYGQLGLGSVLDQNRPQAVGNDYQRVAIDDTHTLALKKDGSFWRWGAIPTSYGRGDFLKEKAKALAPVQAFPGTTHLLRSGYQMGRALGLRDDGTILDWGYVWEIAKPPVAFGREVRAISAGQFASYALKNDGTLWELAQYPINPPPMHVGNDFLKVSVNTDHAYGVKADGSLWGWGNNDLNQLGEKTAKDGVDPVKIGDGFVDVAAGRFHGIALASDGSVWTWGNNEVGVIGDGSTTTRTRPVKVGTGFARIAAGDFHNLALKADGTVWAWGNNEVGQLGDGTNGRRLTPVQVFPVVSGATRTGASPAGGQNKLGIAGHSVKSVRTGLYFSCAVFSDEQVKCWGTDNGFNSWSGGQAMPFPKTISADKWNELRASLGPDRSLNCASAGRCDRIVNKNPFLRGATAIVDDHDVICAIKNGKVRCNDKQDGGSSRRVVDGVNDAVMFDYRAGHGCALQADGRVKCWGDNSHGELGNGTVVTNYGSYRSVASEVVKLVGP